MVAGGQPAGLGFEENVRKECQEEVRVNGLDLPATPPRSPLVLPSLSADCDPTPPAGLVAAGTSSALTLTLPLPLP